MATVTRRLAALLGASGAGLTDSATASKITTDSINDDAVNAAKIAANAVGTSEVADNVLTAADLAANSVGASELDADTRAGKVITTEVQPHIIPGVLYPAVGGKGIDGTTTVTSFGTDFAISGFPTLKYYYTDIKGSKPIKDPRIGAYFGSQRHKFKSLQKLEQETATHGDEVYSVDGRDWIRRVGKFDVHDGYGQQGHFLGHTATGDATNSKYFEIVGYFNAANYLSYVSTVRDVNVFIDGTQNPSSTITAGTAVDTPLAGRYVDSSSVINIPFTGLTTPGIHTLKIANVSGDYLLLFGIELIAQDTTSTANKSKIQIPAQNVVSYGKKFNVSGTPHYDPFSAKTDGSAWTSPTSGTNNANSSASWPTNIDTATSLGLDKWVDGSNYYRPYNGGRVVKWVDSSGTIKTSVTVMPPNAKSIKSADVNKKAKNAPNDTYLPTFEDETTDVNEDLLHEVAKTFHFREFGNGAANTGGGGSWADASMLNAADDIAYVMDDGLTSLGADDVTTLTSPANALNLASDDKVYITFIGTGISVLSLNWDENAIAQQHIAQNLPYGTHILRIYRDSSNNSTILLDGVEVKGSTSTAPFKNPSEITFHQPKKPPIPEDAVILADYMLMADFVAKGATGIDKISKGIRACSVSRDLFYDSGGSFSFDHNPQDAAFGFQSYNNNNTSLYRITSFSTGMGFNGASHTNRIDNAQFKLNGSNFSYNASNIYDLVGEWDDTNDDGTLDLRGTSQVGGTVFGVKNQTLGNNIYEVNNNSNTGYQLHTFIEAHNPIHTSHHYQAFETPYLHELIGGDRNMEQTNLVVSPDGKTWDEVTRDTSYMGKLNTSLNHTQDTASTSTAAWVFDEARGVFDGKTLHNKDFAIGYDRLICLKDGQYQIDFAVHMSTAHIDIEINNVVRHRFHAHTGSASSSVTFSFGFKRGDIIRPMGGYSHADAGVSLKLQNFQIVRL